MKKPINQESFNQTIEYLDKCGRRVVAIDLDGRRVRKMPLHERL